MVVTSLRPQQPATASSNQPSVPTGRPRSPGLDFTVASVASGPLWYALDLWGGPGDDAAFDLKVRTDAANAAFLVSLRSAAQVCAASIDAAPAGIRGFHPAGAADSSGFAAMACDEMLIHPTTPPGASGCGSPPTSSSPEGFSPGCSRGMIPAATRGRRCGRTGASTCQDTKTRRAGPGTVPRSPTGMVRRRHGTGA